MMTRLKLNIFLVSVSLAVSLNAGRPLYDVFMEVDHLVPDTEIWVTERLMDFIRSVPPEYLEKDELLDKLERLMNKIAPPQESKPWTKHIYNIVQQAQY